MGVGLKVGNCEYSNTGEWVEMVVAGEVNSRRVMVKREVNFLPWWHLHFIPVQLRPSPVSPFLQVQMKDPRVLVHVAFEWQGLLEHSSTSEIEKIYISRAHVL